MIPSAPIEDARILAIDDEPMNIRLLEMIFAHAGYKNLRTLMDSTKAVEVFKEFQPDIVLLDLHMPMLDGFQVLELLKPLCVDGPFLPILVLTADIMPSIKRTALSAGASDFVTKPFDTAEVLLRTRNLLMTRSSHVRIANQNQILDSMVQQRTLELTIANRHLYDAQLETLERLAIAGEYRDDDTGQHTRRVGDAAARMASALKLEPTIVELIRRAAPLHDIGKIGISDTILLKPGKLTPEEFAIIKTHTTIGASILSGSESPLLHLAGEIAHSHHERWDGSGYPCGTMGEDIPLPGRIVSICDVFDALTHERPYKKAWPTEDALAEIAKQSGKQFDPTVVDAFMATLSAEVNF